ncbi:unnamed protein product, partial [Symbiodinium necroappetens]
MPWGTRPCTARLRLVECSADVNLVDAHGNTPLILAGIHDKRLVASMLLWGGAERDQQNHRGNTALHEAAISGAKDVAWLIVENGGERSVRIKNQDGKTPLDIAKESGAGNLLAEVTSVELLGQVIQMLICWNSWKAAEALIPKAIRRHASSQLWCPERGFSGTKPCLALAFCPEQPSPESSHCFILCTLP